MKPNNDRYDSDNSRFTEPPNLKKHLVEIYDKYARERDTTEKPEWKAKERNEFLVYLKQEKKTTLLEIGAGTGQDSLFFSEQGFEVTAADISPAMVEICREKGLATVQMDFYDLGKMPRHFDAIFALNCLVHVPKKDIKLVLETISERLNEAGLFYLGMWGGTDFEGILTDDRYEPKRFFAFYRLKSILDIAQKYYMLEYLRCLRHWGPNQEFHSMILRKMK